MSSNRREPYRSSFGPEVLPGLTAVILMLVLVGCSQESEEATKRTIPVAAGPHTGVPKLIDLGATQCIPCKKMAPILEELDVQYTGVLDVEFVDVSQPENKEIAKSYGIEDIPTQVFLDPEGNELWRHVGFISKADILAKWSEFGYHLKPTSDSENQNDEASASDSASAAPDGAAETIEGPSRISVYYLFNTFRCATCRKVESLTKEAVLGTEAVPGPFADDVSAGKLTFESLNIEQEEHSHFLTNFGTQAKIPVIAEISGNRIVRFVVLDKSWFLFDDKPRYLGYVRDAIETFRKNEELGGNEIAQIGEYITALAAFEKAKTSPEEFHIIDVRTPEEHVFIGHPEGARCIPVMFMGYSYDQKMGRQTMLRNADFVGDVQQYYSLDDHLAILGQSGPRAALAVRTLNKAGFKHLYPITHGFVGEKQGHADHADYGKRRVNGWVNEGVPWTTALVPELMYEREPEVAGR